MKGPLATTNISTNYRVDVKKSNFRAPPLRFSAAGTIYAAACGPSCMEALVEPHEAREWFTKILEQQGGGTAMRSKATDTRLHAETFACAVTETDNTVAASGIPIDQDPARGAGGSVARADRIFDEGVHGKVLDQMRRRGKLLPGN